MKVVFASLVASAAAGDWEDYKMFYGKVYNGDDDDAAHKSTFQANLAVIEEQNAKGESLTFGLNQFTDLTQEEFKVAAGFGFIPSANQGSLPILGEHVHDGESLESSIDWEQRGAVTPVKDQGQCGSCWSFSTTGGLEGAWKNTAGQLKSMSEQQFMDCSSRNHGCNGGNVGLALSYASGAAVATESSYSYKAVQGSCKTSFTSAIPNGGVTGYNSVGGRWRGPSVSDMKSALSHGPVSVAIQADQRSFQHYSGGILSSGCGNQLDHAVLIVGYGTDGGKEYWRVKNSWSASWGDAGYIRLATADNVCGILNSQAVYPQVSASVAV